MPIPRRFSVLALSALLIVGCKDADTDTARLSEVMPNLPLPPLATVVSRAGSAEALQITFKSSVPPDSMAAYYRHTLTSGEWNLVNDDRASDGTISLYAERNGPPLWVTIRKDPESNGTLMTLGGAVTPKPDSAAAPGKQSS